MQLSFRNPLLTYIDKDDDYTIIYWWTHYLYIDTLPYNITVEHRRDMHICIHRFEPWSVFQSFNFCPSDSVALKNLRIKMFKSSNIKYFSNTMRLFIETHFTIKLLMQISCINALLTCDNTLKACLAIWLNK